GCKGFDFSALPPVHFRLDYHHWIGHDIADHGLENDRDHAACSPCHHRHHDTPWQSDGKDIPRTLDISTKQTGISTGQKIYQPSKKYINRIMKISTQYSDQWGDGWGRKWGNYEMSPKTQI